MADKVLPDTPAIAGGDPAKKIAFRREPRYGDEEMEELRDALAQGTLFYAQGKKVRQFEEEFAAANGVPFAIACSSGTAAIHAGLIALGISPGDEVITSPITDMGTLVPILYQGAVPVFADLHPRSYALLPDAVEAAITPRTRAIIAVHLWGNACDLEALEEICRRHGLALVEDCAQALGCRYQGVPVGTRGQVGCFSLNEYKHISCGDGGIILCRDESLAKNLRMATDKGYSREKGSASRGVTFLANNYRMTELQGAVAAAQSRKLEEIVCRRRLWCEALTEQLQDLNGILLPQPTPGCNPSWWFYPMRVAPQILGSSADEFAQALRAEGLPAGAHYIGQPIYQFPLFLNHSTYLEPSTRSPSISPASLHPFSHQNYHPGLCPEAEAILDTCVILSINESYSQQDLEETVYAIRRVTKWLIART